MYSTLDFLTHFKEKKIDFKSPRTKKSGIEEIIYPNFCGVKCYLTSRQDAPVADFRKSAIFGIRLLLIQDSTPQSACTPEHSQ